MSAVGHAFWIGTSPLPVEITSHTEWWVQWLPLTGSALVAMAAVVGVILSNKTILEISRQEREEARQRDFLQWRREELRRLGSEVVEAAVEAINEYDKLPTLLDEPITRASLDPIDRACRRLAANAETLRFLIAPVTATRCIELHDLILSRELMEAANKYRAALGRDKEAGLSPQAPSEATRAAESDFNEHLQQVRVALRRVGEAVESALRQVNP